MKNKSRKILGCLLVTGATAIPAVAQTYPETSSEYQLLKDVSTDVVRTGREPVVDKIRLFEKIYASVADTLRAIVIDEDSTGSLSEGDRMVFEESSEQPLNYDFSHSVFAPPNKHPSYRIGNREVGVVPSIVYGVILNGAAMASDSDEFLERVIREIGRETIKDSDSLLIRVRALYENGRH